MQLKLELRNDSPEILCTCYSPVPDKDYEHESDVCCVMAKPITAAEMFHSIEQACPLEFKP